MAFKTQAINSNTFRQIIFLACFLVIAIGILYPGLLMGTAIPSSNEFFWASDMLDVGLPLREFGGRAFREGRLPIWYPGCYGGLPLASIPEAVPYYPLSALFYTFLEPQRATAWTLALHLVLAGLGTALLARRLGACFTGQMLAGLTSSLGLWLPNHFRQMNLMQSAAWVPWVWLMLDRWLERGDLRRGAQLGLATGFMILAGHLQVVHHTAIALTAWAIARLACPPIRWHTSVSKTMPVRTDRSSTGATNVLGHWKLATCSLLMAAGVACATGAAHLLPGLELARFSSRAGMLPSDFLVKFPCYLSYLGTLFNPYGPGSPMNLSVKLGIYWENSQYIGLIPIGIALKVLLASRRIPRGQEIWVPFVAIIATSLLLAHGPFWRPVAWITRLIPGSSALRFPHRYLWFTSLSLTLLGALGMTMLGQHMASHPTLGTKWAVLLQWFVILLTIVDLRYYVPAICPVGRLDAHLQEPDSSRALRKAGALPSFLGERVAAIGVKEVSDQMLQGTGAWGGDMKPYAEVRNLLLAERSSIWGWSSVQGYIGLTPAWSSLAVYDQHRAGIANILLDNIRKKGSTGPQTIELWAKWIGCLGGRWIISAFPLQSPSLKPLESLDEGHFKFYLYKNLAWAGPAWICHHAICLPDQEKVLIDDLIDGMDFRNTVAIMGESATELTGSSDEETLPEPIRIVALSPERIVVHCELATPGYVILNVAWHPRWRALLDGHVSLHPVRANVSQLAVLLPVGRHKLEFTFSSRLEILSLLLSALGLIVGMCLAIGWQWRTATPRRTELSIFGPR